MTVSSEVSRKSHLLGENYSLLLSLNSAKVWNRGFNWPVFGVGMNKKSPSEIWIDPLSIDQLCLNITENKKALCNSMRRTGRVLGPMGREGGGIWALGAFSLDI